MVFVLFVDWLMTKIDVLNKFDTIEIATAYLINGTETIDVPFDMTQTEPKPVLQPYEGWQQDLESCKNFDELPAAARTYIQDLETHLGVPFTMISTGPEREKLLFR